ncbi:hypothetical protein [Salinibacter phage M8CRM-1]|uniref:Uncharacterized protein n=1 Tax=Salinibacter phage M8CRM-1 TaxID=2681612 RepID=A0A2I6UGM7_9CAUD|nr:hypothetical protein FGG67_gp52 [Salinibacter phage M8CRM-1]AUO79139.1 hypothetical protein [Salinibacter phage M8CRM-1]
MQIRYFYILLTCVLLLSAVHCKAQDRVAATLTSRHYVEGTFNESNPGVSAEWDTGRKVGGFRLGVITGGYYNSFERVSAYSAVTGEFGPETDYIRFRITLGLITGYKPGEVLGESYAHLKTPVVPLAVPSIAVGRKRGAEFMFVPGAVGLNLFYTVN